MKVSSPLLAKLTKLEGYGIFSRSGMQEIIHENLNLSNVSQQHIPFYATCVTWPMMQKKYFKLNGLSAKKIEKVLLATSAIPGIFPPVEIDGSMYVDGGLKDNSPITPVYEEGCDLIIVVSLNRFDTIEAHYPNTKIIQLLPREAQGNFISGTLDFKPEKALQRIKEGYEDTLKMITPFVSSMERETTMFQSLKTLTTERHIFQQEQFRQAKKFDQDMAELYKQLEKRR